MEFIGTAPFKGQDTGKLNWTSHEGTAPGQPRSSGQGGSKIPLASPRVADLSHSSRNEFQKRDQEKKRDRFLRKFLRIGEAYETDSDEKKEPLSHGF